MKKPSLAVFCGSSTEVGQEFLDLAYNVGRAIGNAGVRVVYGGASIGMMGRLAEGVLDAGGEIHGSVPRAFSSTHAVHPRLTSVNYTETLSERKLDLVHKSDGFLILPGGYGTADELFEVLALAQIDELRAPIVLYNWHGFFAELVAWLQGVEAKGFGRWIAGFTVVDDIAGVEQLCGQWLKEKGPVGESP